MKVLKDGSIKLSQIDHRVRNFVFSNFSDAVGFCDISRGVQTRVSKQLVVGRMLETAVSQKLDGFLQNYGTMLYYLVGLAPDDTFMREVLASAEACVRRHPEIYGSQEASPEKDRQIIQEEKELHEFTQKISDAAKK